MFAPPTNGYRILIYGRDPALLETRRMLLASAGFEASTVSSIQQLRQSLRRAEPPYELIILCHTVPTDERIETRKLAEKTGIGLYQLEFLETPPRFISTVLEMAPGSGGKTDILLSPEDRTL
jgi:hypothetical protein